LASGTTSPWEGNVLMPAENQSTSSWSRRRFLGQTFATAAASQLAPALAAQAQVGGQGTETGESAPIAIGARRELFLDNELVDRLIGKAEMRLHHPDPKEIVLVHDAPWEGSGSGYHSVFQDGSLYRMYYKAWQIDVGPGTVRTNSHPLFCCYAESDDGIHWRKPELGNVEFQGSKANNIAIGSEVKGPLHIDAGHPAVFKDENPNASTDAKYKAFVRSEKPNGLIPFKSPDGLHWTPMSDGPVITAGAFDSQNLAFWDPNLGAYRAYWRIFTGVGKGRSVRAIRTATSKDFLKWENQADVTYVDSPHEELYTNQVKPYYRAPHLLIGFPSRYTERSWSPSLKALPEWQERENRAGASKRYGTAITDALIMASRDGVRFRRWNESFLRPGIERVGTWNYGHQYLAWHVVETKSGVEDAPNELSLYASENYWTGKSSVVRRYTLRLDGFVSLNAPMSGGELITKPLTFDGSQLRLNAATSAAGSIRVELMDVKGKTIPGFGVTDCEEYFGDSLDRPISWKEKTDVSSLAGKPIRVRFVLNDADVYAFRFGSTDAS